MSERYTIERGDWGLYFYDQKEKKQLSFEDVGDILNGIDELISEIVNDLEELNAWNDNYPKDSGIYIRLKRKREKWEEKLK